jgi:sporulation protein YlmC with PRC-barrel domain
MTSVSKLMGKRVIGANAYLLGEVNGADVDTAKWQVTHLHVSLTNEATRELGFKKPIMGSITVYVPVSLVQAVGDIITLSKGVKELKDVIEPKKHS